MRDKLTFDTNAATVATLDPETSGDRTREEKAFLKAAANDLVTNLFAASKTIRLYSMENRATQRALGELAESVKAIHARESRLVLHRRGDFLHLNDYRVPVDSNYFAPFDAWMGEMDARDLGALEVGTEADATELGRVIKALVETEPGGNAFHRFENRLQVEGLNSVRIAQRVEEEQSLRSEVQSDLREEANRVYFKTVSLMGDILKTNEEKHFLQVRKAKRLTQQMVDIIQTDESLLVGLASIKNFDAYTFAHSVNVCILSMVMGDKFQLSRDDVAKLGVAALFHDIGKTYIPSSIINSTGKLSSQEWELMKYHTFFGVKELSRMRALRDAADPMFVALQHHVHFNDNGYPQHPGGWKLRLFSRIVTVADYYDAMTAQRSYQNDPVTPDKALRFILERSGEIFDPFIAKLFIQAMGLYPIGSIVELDTGEHAVVIGQNTQPEFIHRPRVQIINDGAPESEWPTVDLAEEGDRAHAYKRTVIRTIHDTETHLDKGPCFLADASDD